MTSGRGKLDRLPGCTLTLLEITDASVVQTSGTTHPPDPRHWFGFDAMAHH
jgi:hypothetical protein